jgi:DNA-binding IscR family transcriptional regulator
MMMLNHLSINKIMKKITLDDVILAIDRCEKINEASKKNCKKIKLFNFCLSIYF